MPRSWKVIFGGALLCLVLSGGFLGFRARDVRADAEPPRVSAHPLKEIAQLPGTPANSDPAPLDVVDADVARNINAATPFYPSLLGSARPFGFAGSDVDRERAETCLALAAMAEAGGSDAGQRAVIQVVLNRVRHPAFAKTICGVVFEGSKRVTGCQFSFTCDGSLSRQYSDLAWREARKRAAQALGGKVFAAVGTATHYHTDWVHPVWSGQLRKIAQIDTHLFFRWAGYWGSRNAARIAYHGGEPLPFSDREEALAAALDPALGAEPGQPIITTVAGGHIVARHPAGSAFLIELAARPTFQSAMSMGRTLCSGKAFCRVLGWVNGRVMPKSFPVPEAYPRGLSFSYILDTSKAELGRFDCDVFRDVPITQCLQKATAAADQGILTQKTT
jgi:spore germination cell wall hydrolase CwlJ-like protein